jgi:hypothetical protein
MNHYLGPHRRPSPFSPLPQLTTRNSSLTLQGQNSRPTPPPPRPSPSAFRIHNSQFSRPLIPQDSRSFTFPESSTPPFQPCASRCPPALQPTARTARTVPPISAISYPHFCAANPLSILHLESRIPRTVRTNAQVRPFMDGPFSAPVDSPRRQLCSLSIS